jgi:hypothetical protein
LQASDDISVGHPEVGADGLCAAGLKLADDYQPVMTL